MNWHFPEELRGPIRIQDGSAHSAVILHSPHAGTWILDADRAAFTISPEELALEQLLLTDHATDRLARLVTGVSRVASRLSRLVVDVERFEGDAEEMNVVGMGVLYTRGSHGQPIRTIKPDEEVRLLAWFRTYGEQFADLVDRVLERHGRAVIVDLHSYPAEPLAYELHKDDRRPELCIGVDDRHTPPTLVEAVRGAFDGWDIAVNQPFRGSCVPLRHLGDQRVSSVMLEIRRDRYLDSGGSVDEPALHALSRRVQSIVDATSVVRAI